MSNYISDLRKIVGHCTLMQCAASIICINDSGEILLGKRTDNYKWEYAGDSSLFRIDKIIMEGETRDFSFDFLGIVVPVLVILVFILSYAIGLFSGSIPVLNRIS